MAMTSGFRGLNSIICSGMRNLLRQIFDAYTHTSYGNLVAATETENLIEPGVRHLKAGNKNFIYFMPSTNLAQITVAAIDFETMNHFPFLGRIVIDKTDRRVLQLTI